MNDYIYSWYQEQYPDDELVNEIPDCYTFKDFLETIKSYGDVYEVLGGDTVSRERCYEELSKRSGYSVDELYDWEPEPLRLKGFLVDVENGKVGPIEINQSLDDYYRTLHCDLITTTYIEIDGKEFCVIADDEGLLKDAPKVSIAFDDGETKPMIVGSVLIVSADNDNGNFVSLPDEDLQQLSKHMFNYYDGETQGFVPVIITNKVNPYYQEYAIEPVEHSIDENAVLTDIVKKYMGLEY